MEDVPESPDYDDQMRECPRVQFAWDCSEHEKEKTLYPVVQSTWDCDRLDVIIETHNERLEVHERKIPGKKGARVRLLVKRRVL